MNRKGIVYFQETPVGTIEETAAGYCFQYDAAYVANHAAARAVSITLPLRTAPYYSETLFPFFYGLLAEGVLKEIQCRKLKIDEHDHFGRLLKTAHADTIGAVTVKEA